MPLNWQVALAVSLIATVIKFGDRSQMGAVLLATSLVADLQLLIAAFIWAYSSFVSDTGVHLTNNGQRDIVVRWSLAG